MQEFLITNERMYLSGETNQIVDEFEFLGLNFTIDAFKEVFHIYVNDQFFVTFTNDITNARIKRDFDTQKDIFDIDDWIIERYIFPMLLKRIRDYHV